MYKKILSGLVPFALVFGLAACGNSNNSEDKNIEEESSQTASNMNMDHVDHSSSNEVPKGLKMAENPTYKVGDQVILSADHMKGMKGAEATISGAFDTTAYVVNYKPTTGGPEVKNHKWVVQEEIKDAGNSNSTLEPGKKVTLEAKHMEGMNGAEAEIVSSEKTTVYMVDYTPTTGGEVVKNHKWVTEDEVSAK